MIKINPNDTVYSICKTYPEIKNILASIGFTRIVKMGMLESVGKFMTLKKGAQLKKISLESIQKALLEEGYQLEELE